MNLAIVLNLSGKNESCVSKLSERLLKNCISGPDVLQQYFN